MPESAVSHGVEKLNERYEHAVCGLPKLMLRPELVGSIITTGEAWRRLIVPVALDGEIPVELPQELDVVRSVQIELHSPRLRKGR